MSDVPPHSSHGPPNPPTPSELQLPRSGKSRRFAFYTVAHGSQVGVFQEWLIAAGLVSGYPNAQFRGFHTFEEAANAYLTAMAAHPHPNPEHPMSLVMRVDAPVTSPQATPAPTAAPQATPAPTAAPQATPAPTAAPQATPAPTAAPQVTPAPPAAPQAALASNVLPPTSLQPTIAAPTTLTPTPGPVVKTYSQSDLDELSAVMHSLNVNDMLDFLSGRRRVPGSNPSSSDDALVMSVSLAKNPRPSPGEDPWRVLIRTNLSDAAQSYPCPDNDNDNDANVDPYDDVAAFSTAPPSPAAPAPPELPHAAPAESSDDDSAISVVSTSPSSPSLSSLTTSTAPGATASGNQAHDTEALDTPVPRATRCPCANCRRRRLFEAMPSDSHSATRPSSPELHKTRPLPSRARQASEVACEVLDNGDEWYAIARGRLCGVFRGPLQNLRALLVGYEGAYFQGFQSREAAFAWFLSYAAAQRTLGRRKVSKAQMRDRKRSNRAESNGEGVPVSSLQSTYVDTLAYRSHERDPERTAIMMLEEEDVVAECERLKNTWRTRYEDNWSDEAGWSDVDEDDWRAKYVEDVNLLLNKQLARATDSLTHPCDVPLAQYRAMHTHRRIIAGLHQESELHSQGRDAVIAAGRARAFILSGCRIKKRAFYKIYGF
ncbi:hypothetical protein FA95DRAFT_1609799 [Auriscalpium vulgare]|uniref:Uncharacterized protein n=1 Tax=Auriscalpium vulgare TaxID=40419 RepID=A0ACB8RFG8_9AGAM|nr:hypothetical protein FA95DRAFT_1609799 [Auriscalpium vulgare]